MATEREEEFLLFQCWEAAAEEEDATAEWIVASTGISSL